MTIRKLSSPKIGDVRGFRSVGLAAGLKRSGKPDLGLIVSDGPCSAAGVFTRSRVPAAPVVIDREILKKNSTAIRAVVVHSGHANAATGASGLAVACATAGETARQVGAPAGSVLVCSTGVIGDLPPKDTLLRGIAAASKKISSADRLFSRCILTTDKVEKISGVQMRFPNGSTARMVGVCKGSGMIAPNMATMLAFIVTDAAVAPAILQRELRSIADETFNAVSVDGDTSTNDTVLLLAGGMSGAAVKAKTPSARVFSQGLRTVCEDLAQQLVRDGEGATKLIEVVVRGTRSPRSARRAARTVAESLLVKTAMHGEDPNVGRVMAALGRSGIPELRPDRIDVSFNGVRAVRRGVVDRQSSAAALRKALGSRDIRIEIELSSGPSSGRFLSCDLSSEYVRINSEYRT